MNALRPAGFACSALLGLLLASTLAFGQSESARSSAIREGTPLIELLDTVAKSSNKTFILDPRVQGNVVMVGVDPEKITYTQLLAALQVHGFAAVEIGGITRIVPDAQARAMATPILSGNEKRDPSEIVTHVFKVKSTSAGQLVPILRSLLPQSAHLASNQCTNELVVVDSYANVKRIESIVASIDKGPPLNLEPCSNRGVTMLMPQPARPPSEDR
jgi:type II secretory pathway component GspD/PulD (secretin)